MKFLIATLFSIALLGAAADAQTVETWGCPTTDYKCQLDVRMKALKENPKDPENYYNLALVFQRSGNYKQAIETYTMYLAIPGIKPEHQADAYNNRGISYRASKQPDLAVADYEKAMSLKPADPNLVLNRANAYNDLGKKDLAAADYDRLVRMAPNYGFGWAQRGNFLQHNGKPDEALIDYAKAIQLDPTYPEPYYNRSVIMLARKDYAKVVADLDKYIPLMAHNPAYLADGHLNRGVAHYYLGASEKAIADLNKVIELRPTWPNPYTVRAAVYRKMNRIDLAEADEKKAAALKGDK